MVPLAAAAALMLASFLCKVKTTKDGLQSAAMFVVFLVYPSATSITFNTFNCEGLDDGKSVLRLDRSIDCASEGHLWYRW
jgi:hypothetical protein